MTKRRSIGNTAALIAAAVLIPGLLASCSSSAGSSAGGSGKYAACPASASKKITGDTITAGSSGALSGSFAVIGDVNKAAKAYFDYYNKQGGIKTVDGKKQVKLILKDDQYKPSATQANVHELVEKDKVSAMISTAGTATAEAAASYLNQQCVPQLFPASGSPTLSSKTRPFTFQSSSYADQAAALAKFVTSKDKSATVAVLYRGDDVGQALLDGFEQAIKGTDIKIVGKESYDPTATSINSQMTTLSATKADFFLNATVGGPCTQALASIGEGAWKPTVIMGLNCNQSNILLAPKEGTTNLYSSLTSQSQDSSSDAMKLFKKIMDEAGLKPTGEALVGYSSAQLAAWAITNAKELTPIGIAKGAAAISGKAPTDNISLPGITFDAQPGKPLISSYNVAKWDTESGVFDTDNGAVIKVR